jgi:hypothetical protein
VIKSKKCWRAVSAISSENQNHMVYSTIDK